MRGKLPFLVEVAIEPKTVADAEKLASVLEQLAADESRLGLTTDKESGQTILRGTSEELLEETLDRIDVPFNVGAPQVAYHEKIISAISIRHVHKRLTGSTGQFALVEIAYEPMPEGMGIVFETTVQDPFLNNFASAVEKGTRAQAEGGLIAGFPVTDFKATLIDGAYHEVDSSELAFNIAARAAFRELVKHNAIQILEPIMKIDVTTPEDFLGPVIGDLNSRRGRIERTGTCELNQLITATVPLANMFGYRNTLHAMCEGRATYEMQFDHYERVPIPSDDDPRFPGAMAMRIA